MQIPPEVKPALWGAAGGAAVLAIIGFWWGGWVTSSTAETMAKQRADSAVVEALAPICADKFRHATGSDANLVQLKAEKSWERADFIEKGGWATLPGSETPGSGVAKACADLLGAET